MDKKVVICLVLSAVFLVSAFISHFYEARSMGLLPVMNYPLRPYVLPFVVISLILAATGIFLQTRKAK